MKISVALCTYRGERFLSEQLESILRQTQLPHELIIADDASDDGTVSVARGMIDRFHDVGVGVSLHRNVRTLGVAPNFEMCLRHTTGDVIFLCDQDDVWHPNKVAAVVREMTERPDLLLLFTDARLIDARGAALLPTLFDAIEMTERERRLLRRGAAFDVLLRRNVVTGATVALRRDLLTAAIPFGPDWVHDEWLAIVAAATGRVGMLDVTTIDYRQHEANQIGARLRSKFELAGRLRQPNYVDRFSQERRMRTLHERIAVLDVSDRQRAVVAERYVFDEFRAAYPTNRLRRVGLIVRQCVAGRYVRFARPRTLIRDLLVPARWL